MYIQRVLLLVAILLAIFAPALELWVFASPMEWHRPFLIWLLIIIAIFAGQRANHRSTVKNDRRKPTSNVNSDLHEQPLRRASDDSTRRADQGSGNAV